MNEDVASRCEMGQPERLEMFWKTKREQMRDRKPTFDEADGVSYMSVWFKQCGGRIDTSM